MSPISRRFSGKCCKNNLRLIVASIEGKQVFEMKTAPTASYELDVSSFSNGIYILDIETSDNTVVTQKFIKG